MKLTTYSEQTIWIIGASSGIGKALAEALHPLGAKLVLSARSRDKLQQLNHSFDNQHHCLPLDISDSNSVYQAAQVLTRKYCRIDRIILLSAIYYPQSLDALDLEQVRETININLLGVFNLIHTVLPILKQQNNGQLAICGSVSGYCGLPNGQPYSATKAAVINLCESLRAETNKEIDIKVINPGFVKTPMTDTNTFKMPMIITPEKAAQTIIKDLTSTKFESHFPKRFTFLVKLLKILPYSWALHISKKMKKNH